jgi:uncharacterized protein (DUF58 family)
LFARSFAVLGLAFALILIGINSQAGWLFWLASILLAALIVSWILSMIQVRGLEVKREHKEELAEDESLDIKLSVYNRGLLARSLLEVIDCDPYRPGDRKPRMSPPRKSVREQWRDPSPPVMPTPEEAGGQAAFLLPRVAGRSKTEVSYTRGSLRRGVYEDWPAFLYSEGIIGLARHNSRVSPPSRLVVFPSYALLKSFPFIDSSLHPHHAPYGISLKGAGMDYYGVREYRAGDDLRHVHWKTTARRGELAVREFEMEVGVPLVILIDNQEKPEAPRGSPWLDSSARLAASIARYAHYAGHPVALAAYRGKELDLLQIPSFRGALYWLAELAPEAEIGPEEQVQGLGRQMRPGYFFCHILPATPFDYSRMAAAIPRQSQSAVVLVDMPSHAETNGRQGLGPSAEQLLAELESCAVPGLFSVSLYRKGDDLRQCLEKPLITCAGSLYLET